MSRWQQFRKFGLCAALVPLLLTALQSQAQEKNQYGERSIEPEQIAFDKDGIWTLNFKFKDPRIIDVEIPARGKTRVWYMFYQVYNNSGEPRQFVPQFEIVTLDKNTSHIDEVLPSVQDEIIKLEDPQDKLKIKNSVTIGKDLIPISRADAFPRMVSGVVIWPDIAEKAPRTSRFSVFISGLSDGWVKDDNGVIRRKTLQINYRRSTDGRGIDTSDLKLDPETPFRWIYRATGYKPKSEEKKEPTPKVEEKNGK